MVLQAILEAQGDWQAFIEDSRIAQATKISLADVRIWFMTLDHDEYVDLALTETGMSASVTAKVRLALALYWPFPMRQPSALERSRSRSKTGRRQPIVISIINYRPPVRAFPAVANDVREIADLLRSDKGMFPAQNVVGVVDPRAKREPIMAALEVRFQQV
jgi:hypothetical protein